MYGRYIVVVIYIMTTEQKIKLAKPITTMVIKGIYNVIP